MSTSQNGWPVVPLEAIDRTPILGSKFPNGFLIGDVHKAFTWLFTQMHTRVEPIDPGSCWGYFVKPIEGTTNQSNHSSGTAGDWNASQHPMGVHNTFTSRKRATIQLILNEANGVFRWGGNYTGRPDEMHFEINTNRAGVAAFVNQIERPIVNLTDADVTAIWTRTVGHGPLNAEQLLQNSKGNTDTIREAVAALENSVDDINTKLDLILNRLPGTPGV